MSVKVDPKTRSPYDTCVTCYKRKLSEKKASEEKSKSTAAVKKPSLRPTIPLRPTAATATALIPVVDSNDFMDFYTDDDTI